jgi:hypothetical protein
MKDLERFDDSGLPVTGFSRRQALKVGAVSLGGAILAGIMPGRVWADAGGNSDCAHFCNSIYPPGPARGKCKSDGAHHQGLCTELCPSAAVCVSFCDAADTCGCVPTTEAFSFCHQGISCFDAQSCTSSSDCPPDRPVCASTCCPGNICVPACNAPSFSGAVRQQVRQLAQGQGNTSIG